MTYYPRFFVDPLSGSATYAAEDQLSVTQFNTIHGGVRRHDKAIERKIINNWLYHTESSTACDTSCVCWSPGHSKWVEGRQTAAGSTGPAAFGGTQTDYMIAAGAVPAEDGLTVTGITAFGNYVVMCGDPSVSSAKKYRTTIDLSTWSAGNSAVANAKSVNSVCHHYVSGIASLFVSGGEDGAIETSPTGITWTARTNPNANTISSIVSNGSIVVAISNATTNNCVTSADGDTWVQRTMATTASWSSICWVPNQKKWFAVGIGSTQIVYNTSSDGITWSSVTQTSADPLVSLDPVSVVSTGNAVIMTASDARVYVSHDLGITWCQVLDLGGAPTIGMLATASDPEGVPCQLMTISEDANTHYYMTFVGS